MRKLFLQVQQLIKDVEALEAANDLLEERIEALEIKSNRKPGRPPKEREDEAAWLWITTTVGTSSKLLKVEAKL
jgi:hypothetical protein